MGSITRELTMQIDLEQIVREEVRALLQEHLHIILKTNYNVEYTKQPNTVIRAKNADKSQPAATPTSAKAPPGVTWEYAAEKGKRRPLEQIELHKKEIELGRNLTPEEKGQIAAGVEMDTETQEKAKANAKEKARVDAITKETTEIAKQELEKETKSENSTQLFEQDVEVASEKTPEQEEATKILERTKEEQKQIPETKELDLNSLFK